MRHVYFLTTICFSGFCFAALVGACGDSGGNAPLTVATGTGPTTTTGGGEDPGDGGGGSTTTGDGGTGGDPTGMGGTPMGGMGGDGGSGGPPPLPPECGDGTIDEILEEECDDDNTINGDGCSAACEVETGWDCGMLQPSNCTINTCDPDFATDMTAMTSINLGNPALLTYPYCIKAKLGTIISVGNDGAPAVGDVMLIGGFAGAGGSKTYDGKSNIQPSCATKLIVGGACVNTGNMCKRFDFVNACTFDPNNGACYTGGCWNMETLGAKPFVSNFLPGTQKGAIFVVP